MAKNHPSNEVFYSDTPHRRPHKRDPNYSVTINTILRRVDMPITAASTQLAKTPSKKNKIPTLKQGLFASLYLLVGAGLFNIMIDKAHADDLLPVMTPPYCSIYTPEPAHCNNATHLFPQGFIDNIKRLNQPAEATDAVKKNNLF